MLYSLFFLSYVWVVFDVMSKTEGLDHMLQDATCDIFNEDFIEDCELEVVTTDESDDPCLQFHLTSIKPIGDGCNFFATVTLTDGAGEEQDIGISTNATISSILIQDNSFGKELRTLANFPQSQFPIPEGEYSNECHMVSDSLLPKMLQRGLYTMYCTLECGNKPCFKISVTTEVM